MKTTELRAREVHAPRVPDRMGIGLLVLAIAGVVSAQGLPARMAELRHRVATKPAERLVVPAQSAVETPVEPAAQVPATESADTSDATAPSTAVVDDNSARATAEATVAAPNESLPTAAAVAAPEEGPRPGLYTVQLGAADERLATQAIVQQVASFKVGSQAVTFPGLVRHIGTDQESLDLKPYALAGGPLKLLTKTGEFVGSLKIGVATLGLSGRHKLSTPLTFQVLDEGVADPDNVSLDQTSPPFATVRIKTSQVREPFIVRVASEFAPEGIPVTFKVSPTLFLKTDRRVIQGFGLETTHISVYTMGVPDPEGIRVNIEADPSAHLMNSFLTLDAKGRADTVLRSDATGLTRITASTAGFADVTRDVAFAAPWRTLAASVIGGLMGGVVRVVPSLRREKQKFRVGPSLLVSTLVGLLVFGLTVLGVNVLPVDFAVHVGDVFVLIVSALGGFVGTAALKSVLASKSVTT